mmetsp:Transcript_111745/g.310938  ORF Transcript_111745/g.310938 Transcript_111745/m.310938 type:complete len:213 (-) Transcript_111745:12-650(-)
MPEGAPPSPPAAASGSRSSPRTWRHACRGWPPLPWVVTTCCPASAAPSAASGSPLQGCTTPGCPAPRPVTWRRQRAPSRAAHYPSPQARPPPGPHVRRGCPTAGASLSVLSSNNTAAPWAPWAVQAMVRLVRTSGAGSSACPCRRPASSAAPAWRARHGSPRRCSGREGHRQQTSLQQFWKGPFGCPTPRMPGDVQPQLCKGEQGPSAWRLA